MALTVRPLHPLFAAEVRGLDLREPPDAALGRAIDDVMNRAAVSVLPEQFITDEQQLRFTRLFGTPELAPMERGRPVVPGADDRIRLPEIFDISNLDMRGTLLPVGDKRRTYSIANQLWHTDSSFRQLSATFSMLSARELPPRDANTEFADMRAAYDALGDAMKARLEGLVAEHSIWHSRSKLGGYVPTAAERAARPPAQHRLVRIHPGSKRKTLYIANHISHILGWPAAASDALIDELLAHATERRFVYAHQWRPGDLVIWDNRATMHRATPFEDGDYRRDMRRTTVREDVAEVV